MLKKISYCLFLLVVLFTSITPVYSADLRSTIFDTTKDVARTTFDVDNTDNNTLFVRLARATNVFVGVLGVLTAIFIIYAGFLWLTAGGNDDQIKKAKTTIRRVIIGVIVVTVAYALIAFIVGQISPS